MVSNAAERSNMLSVVALPFSMTHINIIHIAL